MCLALAQVTYAVIQDDALVDPIEDVVKDVKAGPSKEGVFPPSLNPTVAEIPVINTNKSVGDPVAPTGFQPVESTKLMPVNPTEAQPVPTKASTPTKSNQSECKYDKALTLIIQLLMKLIKESEQSAIESIQKNAGLDGLDGLEALNGLDVKDLPNVDPVSGLIV